MICVHGSIDVQAGDNVDAALDPDEQSVDDLLKIVHQPVADASARYPDGYISRAVFIRFSIFFLCLSKQRTLNG